ncbi:MAG: hypothetical protein IKX94_03955 [Muribaculaceae bacterium]|nr:hypothetical protein [Muribaculaceae bacterium]
MSCLAKLLFLPILLVFILILMLFSMFRGGSKRVFTSSRRQEPEPERDDDRSRQRYDNAETVDYEELPPADKTDDNESDYDPNPNANNRIEDAKWEEIDE